MIFEIFNHVLVLEQNMQDLSEMSLGSGQSDSVGIANESATLDQAISGDSNKACKRPKEALFPTRPRAGGVFWSIHPSKTPVATAYPVLGSSLEWQRKSLPAFKARDAFLSSLRDAHSGSRVVFVTGATGSGKTTQIPNTRILFCTYMVSCCVSTRAKVLLIALPMLSLMKCTKGTLMAMYSWHC